MIDRESFLWSYLQTELKQLLSDGEIIAQEVKKDAVMSKITDFSFLVFPFAKAYEGFLKKLFLDIGMIHYDEYYGDDIRIGRLLNPHYQHEAGNLFAKMCNHSEDGKHLSQHLWDAWKSGRNLIFHYFPHNYKRLTYDDAMIEVELLLKAMETAVVACKLNKSETLVK